jgi:hypothetical protein
MISRHMSVALREQSKWIATKDSLWKPDQKVPRKSQELISVIFTPPLDVVFADTFGDINVCYDSSDASNAGCCSTPLPSSTIESSCCATISDGLQSPRPNFDANEWVGTASYQIYALKPQSSWKVSAEISDALLR